MRERNRRAREYSQRCWERRWNRRLWILNALMILLIIGILLWALTLPEAQEPEDAPPPLSTAVQAAVRRKAAGESAGMRHHRLLRLLHALCGHQPQRGRAGADGLWTVGLHRRGGGS